MKRSTTASSTSAGAMLLAEQNRMIDESCQREGPWVTLPRSSSQAGVSGVPRSEMSVFRSSHSNAVFVLLTNAGLEMIGTQGPLSQQLRQQIERDRQLAKSYEQIAKQKTPRKFLRQCRVLWAWHSAGGDIGITTRPGKAPEGAVIPFFQAASVVVGGKTPGAWQIKDIVSRYQKVNYTPIVSVSKVTAEPTFIPRAPHPVDESTPAVDAIGEDQEHSDTPVRAASSKGDV